MRRVVVGAHYGLRDWLAQRVTGAIIAAYALWLGATWLASAGPLTYDTLRGFFGRGGVRVATFLCAASLAWHAWVGMRDILMDYVKPTAIRLALEIVVLLTVAAYLGWTLQILWR